MRQCTAHVRYDQSGHVGFGLPIYGGFGDFRQGGVRLLLSARVLSSSRAASPSPSSFAQVLSVLYREISRICDAGSAYLYCGAR